MPQSIPLVLGTIAASLALHEAGHLGMAVATGATIKGFGFTKFCQPYVHVRVEPPCRWKASLNLLAGPLVHLFLGSLLFLTDPLAQAIGLLNLQLGFFNLILPKSDGWQFAKLYL